MAKILLVDDDIELNDNVCSWLKMDHHTLEAAHSGGIALELILNFQFDLVILDWDLPEISGIDLCKRLREKDSTTPVLMLTGKGEIADKTVGFNAGADDYLTKPFHLAELGLRVRALLRRKGSEIQIVLKARDLEMEPHNFVVRKSGNVIKLLPKEFSLLEFLMQHPNQIFSLDALLDRVWMSDSDATTAAVHACIRRLRKKIDDPGAESMIANVHGVGYRLDA